MEKLLWPQRKRCRKCRRYFGFAVVAWLYCSYECADIPVPLLGDLPRQCFLSPKRGGHAKKGFVLREDAEAHVQAQQRNGKDPYLGVYPCEHCSHFHIGHRYPQPS